MKLVTSTIERTEINKNRSNKTNITKIKEFTPENYSTVEFLSPMVLVLELIFKTEKSQ